MHIIKKPLTTRVITVLTIGILILALSETAHGYFSNDVNFIDRGTFSTGKIAVLLEADTPNHVVEVGEHATFTLTTADASTVATQSKLTFKPHLCRAEFYNAILLEVTVDSGASMGTFEDVVVSEVGIPSNYELDAVISSNFSALQNESCSILVTLETWQGEFTDATNGFSDVDTRLITFTINEPIEPPETTTSSETTPVESTPVTPPEVKTPEETTTQPEATTPVTPPVESTPSETAQPEAITPVVLNTIVDKYTLIDFRIS